MASFKLNRNSYQPETDFEKSCLSECMKWTEYLDKHFVKGCFQIRKDGIYAKRAAGMINVYPQTDISAMLVYLCGMADLVAYMQLYAIETKSKFVIDGSKLTRR